MGELINGRTPEEIKAAIEKCVDGNCEGCAYYDVMGCSTTKAYDALAYIERLEAAQQKWISVKDRLPDEDGEYLVLKRHNYRKDDGYMAQEVTLFLKTRDPEWVVGNLVEVTHWMPLPESPKED